MKLVYKHQEQPQNIDRDKIIVFFLQELLTVLQINAYNESTKEGIIRYKEV